MLDILREFPQRNLMITHDIVAWSLNDSEKFYEMSAHSRRAGCVLIISPKRTSDWQWGDHNWTVGELWMRPMLTFAVLIVKKASDARWVKGLQRSLKWPSNVPTKNRLQMMGRTDGHGMNPQRAKSHAWVRHGWTCNERTTYRRPDDERAQWTTSLTKGGHYLMHWTDCTVFRWWRTKDHNGFLDEVMLTLSGSYIYPHRSSGCTASIPDAHGQSITTRRTVAGLTVTRHHSDTPSPFLLKKSSLDPAWRTTA